MNLYSKLQQRASDGRPLRVGLIGAGKFAAMYLAQVPKIPGVQVVGIADIAPDNAKTNLDRVGWKAERYSAGSLDAACAEGTTNIDEDWRALVSHPQIDIGPATFPQPVDLKKGFECLRPAATTEGVQSALKGRTRGGSIEIVIAD